MIKSEDKLQNEFTTLLKETPKDIAFEELMISLRFISEIDKLMEEKQLSKKELAARINTSAAYVTQLFRGKKILNMHTLAKIQEVFGVVFRINAESTEIGAEFSHLKESDLTEPEFEAVDWIGLEQDIYQNKSAPQKKILKIVHTATAA